MVSLMVVTVSAVSFYFSVQSWRESDRPLVTARVTSFGLGGNVAIALSLLIENTGSRPAENVKLKVKDEVLSKVILSNAEHEQMVEAIRLCFSERGVIPVLANGMAVHNNFGLLKGELEETWSPNSRFDVTLQYEDLDGRTYDHTNPLLLADDRGFAGSFWNSVHASAKKQKEI